MIALAALLALFADATASPAPSPAVIHFSGETTDGKPQTYPDDARGKSLVLVVAFTQKGSDAAQTWSHALEQHIGTRTVIVGVGVLDKAPGFLRGMIKNKIDKQVGPPEPGKAGFVTTFDGTTLRAAAPSGNDDIPVIYIFRADGTLAAAQRAAYSENAESAVEKLVP